ncbi:MAG: NAD(P)/FAD-dependent oxidoreductase [Gammaproteobacteria bacterium]|nr:NAD(P)/FAD-dependent oxidoreductase [Gammaproteobacteria bacterium]
MSPGDLDDQEIYDATIIGAGVVGCAVARHLALEGYRVLVLEKAADILDGASKGNSAILHTGFDAPPGSLESRCMADGYSEYLQIHKRLGLPLIRCGALVLAWNDEEEARLPLLIEQARANGVLELERLSRSETFKLEPALAKNLKAAFRVPGESLIDPWSAPYAYLLQAVYNQAMVKRSCEVLHGEFDGQLWHLTSNRGRVRSHRVINAAGLFGDIVDQRLLGGTDFTIHPRKGQFIVYDKPAAALSSHILLPVPNEVTKGIVVCRTAFGNLLVGPTAEEQQDRDNAELVQETLLNLRERGEQILPGLAHEEVTAIYAGLRPASEFKDYQIKAHRGKNYITIGGIRSTGLSSALGIARYVHSLCDDDNSKPAPLAETDIQWPRLNTIAEDGTDDQQRDWQCPGNDGIVCHCELVTRREIESALSGPLAPRSLAGLKRRTRVTMGRCQGFYCSAELAKITEGRLRYPMAGNRKNDA